MYHIHYGYVAFVIMTCSEWLIDRKKVPLKWQDTARRVRDQLEKTRAATTSQNPEVKSALLKGDNLTYFDCRHILELLEAEEGSSAKNIFGQYNNPVLRQWSGIIKTWSKENIYLAESSRLLIQWASYEGPALKKTLNSCEKQISEINRRSYIITTFGEWEIAITVYFFFQSKRL